MIAVLLAACASGGTGSSSDRETMRVSGSAMRMRGGEGAKVATVDAPLSRVWMALPIAYDSLGIELTDVDNAMHSLGTTGMKAFKILGKVPLSTYLECGNAQAFQSADTYAVQLAVRTQVDSASAGGTRLSTLVEAVARPLAFAGEYVRCSTKGELEERIAAIVRAHLGATR
ncbi:MAG TPA: hypothetical protein VF929_11710 [Gemmatimonadaceae bacterium]